MTDNKQLINDILYLYDFCDRNKDAVIRIPREYLSNLSDHDRKQLKAMMNRLIDGGYLSPLTEMMCVAFPYVCSFTRSGIELIDAAAALSSPRIR